MEEYVLRECNGENSIQMISQKHSIDFYKCLEIVKHYMEEGNVIIVVPMQAASHNETKIKVGIFSPHPDDAILACGGSLIKYLMSSQNIDLSIINVFSKENYSILPFLQKDEVMAEKVILEEEKSIQKALRCKTINLGFLDALLRDYKSVKDIFYRKGIHLENAMERDLLEAVGKRIKKNIIDEQFNYVLFPYAIGGHIDHLITKESILNIATNTFDCKFYFYEDQPYVTTSIFGKKELEKLEQLMKPIYVCITESFEHKKNLLGAYKTQLTVQQIDKVIEYSKKLKGDLNYYERLWSFNE